MPNREMTREIMQSQYSVEELRISQMLFKDDFLYFKPIISKMKHLKFIQLEIESVTDMIALLELLLDEFCFLKKVVLNAH